RNFKTNFIEVEGKILMKTAPLSGTNYNSAFNRMKIINIMTGNIPAIGYPSKRLKDMVICSHLFGVNINREIQINAPKEGGFLKSFVELYGI
ncbi:MAG: hypothetical protein ACTSPW_14680, partial [Promethearchaeota archaeon]